MSNLFSGARQRCRNDITTHCRQETVSCVAVAIARHPPILNGSLPVHTGYNFRMER